MIIRSVSIPLDRQPAYFRELLAHGVSPRPFQSPRESFALLLLADFPGDRETASHVIEIPNDFIAAKLTMLFGEFMVEPLTQGELEEFAELERARIHGFI
jgi:hypothetical protein